MYSTGLISQTVTVGDNIALLPNVWGCFLATSPAVFRTFPQSTRPTTTTTSS